MARAMAAVIVVVFPVPGGPYTSRISLGFMAEIRVSASNWLLLKRATFESNQGLNLSAGCFGLAEATLLGVVTRSYWLNLLFRRPKMALCSLISSEREQSG